MFRNIYWNGDKVLPKFVNKQLWTSILAAPEVAEAETEISSAKSGSLTLDISYTRMNLEP